MLDTFRGETETCRLMIRNVDGLSEAWLNDTSLTPSFVDFDNKILTIGKKKFIKDIELIEGFIVLFIYCL